MSDNSQGFRFKQFFVRHQASTMRVGTDAVLLGSWVQPLKPSETSRCLDIGSGCGVISLMLAQRFPQAKVLGFDIDEASVKEAKLNAQESPFSDRVDFALADVTNLPLKPSETSLKPSETLKPFSFDLIVSNPPFYQEDTLPPDDRRAKARNARHLTADTLVHTAVSLLSSNGSLALVLPIQSRDIYVDAAINSGLYLYRECQIRTTSSKPVKRVLLQFCRQPRQYNLTTLTLLNPSGFRSDDYIQLCQDFYL